MNYSVAGFQVDCLVKNFVKSLLGAIYAVKIISMALIYRMKEVEGILCQNFFLHNVNILLSSRKKRREISKTDGLENFLETLRMVYTLCAKISS